MAENLDFKTNGTITKEDVQRLQNRLLEMAKITASILDRYGYHYILTYGSLLGAVRHQGFIPWDDDFDLFLFYDEYDAAVRCLREHLPEDMIVHDKKTDPIYWPAWSRIRDLHSRIQTDLYPDDKYYKYTGISLDLYCLKKMKRDEVSLWKKKSAIEFLVRKHDVGVLPDELYQARFNEWTEDYVRLLQEKKMRSYQNDEVYSDLGSTALLLTIDDIFPLKKYIFEDTEFWGPNNSDKMLKIAYGDYMEIPPFDQRIVHYSSVEFD